jgi:hypothetical protein
VTVPGVHAALSHADLPRYAAAGLAPVQTACQRDASAQIAIVITARITLLARRKAPALAAIEELVYQSVAVVVSSVALLCLPGVAGDGEALPRMATPGRTCGKGAPVGTGVLGRCTLLDRVAGAPLGTDLAGRVINAGWRNLW